MNLRLWLVPEGDGHEQRVLCRLGNCEPVPLPGPLQGLTISYRQGSSQAALVSMLTTWEDSDCGDLQYFTLDIFRLVATAGYRGTEIDFLVTARELLTKYPIAAQTLSPLLETRTWQQALTAVYDHCLKLGGHR